jgi:hypothetical protein
MQSHQGLIQFIGQKLGLHDLALDEHRHASITFDDAITVTFLAEEGGELTVLSYVADYQVKNTAQEQVGRHLLGLNFLPAALGGGKLAISPQDNAIVLTRSWDPAITDGETLFIELEAFVNAVSAIREEIARVTHNEPVHPDGESVGRLLSSRDMA